MSIGIIDLETAVNLLTKKTAFTLKIPNGELLGILNAGEWERAHDIFWCWGHKESADKAYEYTKGRINISHIYRGSYSNETPVVVKDGAFYIKDIDEDEVKLDYLIALSPTKYGFKPLLVELSSINNA